MLLGAKVDINATNPTGDTALITSASEGQLACLQLLVDTKAAIDATNGVGNTALITAVSHDHTACAHRLCSTQMRKSMSRTTTVIPH